MTTETLSSIAGVILSLAFSYLPGLQRWYAALDGTAKRLVMLGVLTATTLCFYALACTPYAELLGISLSCDAGGAVMLLRLLLSALIANQATYSLTPRSAAHGASADPHGQALKLGGAAQ
ncbi:MAG: hypothetical protein ACK44E_08180 [Anaerolineales bacterium]